MITVNMGVDDGAKILISPVIDGEPQGVRVWVPGSWSIFVDFEKAKQLVACVEEALAQIIQLRSVAVSEHHLRGMADELGLHLAANDHGYTLLKGDELCFAGDPVTVRSFSRPGIGLHEDAGLKATPSRRARAPARWRR